MKITYDPIYKPLVAYFNKLHQEIYKKSLYGSIKTDHLNDRTVLL